MIYSVTGSDLSVHHVSLLSEDAVGLEPVVGLEGVSFIRGGTIGTDSPDYISNSAAE
jgi:hypothetical protein